MLTENQKKANSAHDELARVLDHCNHVKELHGVAKDLEKIYTDMLPMFADMLRSE